MPCSDGGAPYPPSPAEIATANFAKRAPGLLCSACRALDRLGFDFDENPELSDWWAKHKKEDDARIERENKEAEVKAFERRVIEQALIKPFGDLSKDELKILRKNGYM